MRTIHSSARSALSGMRQILLLSILAVLTVLYWSIALEALASDTPFITGRPANPTRSRTASFTFTAAQTGRPECSIDDTAFAPCASPRLYFGLAEGVHTFAVKTVRSATESPAAGYTWVVDLTPPPAPTFTRTPADPALEDVSTFAWVDAEAGVSFECSLDSGSWWPCRSPYRVSLADDDRSPHRFGVRAVDRAGNTSWGSYASFTRQRRSAAPGLPFTVTGSVSGLTIGVAQPIRVTLTNPNPVAIGVVELAVTISADSTPSGCRSAGNVRLTQSSISMSRPVVVPALGSVTLPAQGVAAPQILLVDLPTVNQDACRNKSFTLTYSGRARS